VTERACVKCGTVFDGRYCKVCKKAIAAAYYAVNREAHMAKTNAWRQANPDAVRVIRKAAAVAHRHVVQEWRKANPEKVQAYGRAYRERYPALVKARLAAWRARHPEARSIHEHNRRAKSAGKLTRGIRQKLFALQRGKCACCKARLGRGFHLDHIMPLALGGKNVDGNLQLLRSICNMRKHASHPVDYMQKQGFLL
jgi:5-methylcytosine-specific restriction endonuclease McrA